MNKIHEWVNTGLIILVAILVLVGGKQSVPSNTVGAARVNQTALTGLSLSYSVSTSTYDSANGGFIQNGRTSLVESGTCMTGTSTLFALKSPLGATSTAIVDYFTGTGNATSSNILIGTSTKSSGLVSTDVSASMVNGTIGTATPAFTMASGIRVGSLGQVDAGSGTYSKIFIGPTDSLVGFSTSTYGGAGALNFTPGFSTCSYKIIWED